MRNLAQLALVLRKLASTEGTNRTLLPDVFVNRSSSTDIPRQANDQPFFCVVAQGGKQILVGSRLYRCEPGKYLLCTLGVPMSGQVTEATRENPYLGLSLILNFNEIASIIQDAGFGKPVRLNRYGGIAAYTIDEDLLDAITRLAELLTTPERIRIMGPILRREIYYKLLIADNHAQLYRMSDENQKVQRVLSGLAWLKQNATRKIRMTELAERLNMSISSMNYWFRNVTAISPLQFQNQLRLQEARLIMTTEDVDVTTASMRVGYESPSQFNREYKRFFGAPPRYDVKRLRGGV